MANLERDAAIVALANVMTLEQIGRRYGLTRQRVSKIIQGAGVQKIKVVPSLTERFWPRVRRAPEGCWEWLGARYRNSYGHFYWEPAGGYAHRASWIMANGPIPVGLWVLHRCDNPPCVRPDHLFLGTAADNTADRDRKGRRRNQYSPA